jgi:hypothetical protein
MADLLIKRGSTAPFLTIDLTEGGAPADLTTATLVRLTGRKGGVTLITADLPSRDPAGRVVYQWAPTDLATVGVWRFQVDVTKAGKVAKHPTIVVEVVDSLS